MKNKIIWCDRGCFRGFFFYFGLCTNEKSWRKFLKKTAKVKDIPPFPTAAGNTSHWSNNKNRLCIVTLNLSMCSDSRTAYNILVHEAVHVWQDLCDYIGEENPSVEFEAYMIQSISQELWTAYDRITKE